VYLTPLNTIISNPLYTKLCIIAPPPILKCVLNPLTGHRAQPAHVHGGAEGPGPHEGRRVRCAGTSLFLYYTVYKSLFTVYLTPSVQLYITPLYTIMFTIMCVLTPSNNM
jgi:hypothetical protein